MSPTGLSLAQQRCFTHGFREAAARCPSCRRFFCRECVTEHEGKVLCASCLLALTAGAGAESRGGTWLLRFVQAAIGFVFVWLLFYYLGQILLSIPDSFHDNLVWRLQ